jgi:hypothetical protein
MTTTQKKKQFRPRYCATSNLNVLFIAKMNDSLISLIALAASLSMHGLHWICASISGAPALEEALGIGKVTRLPADALAPESTVLSRLAQRARDEDAVLLIEAEVDPDFSFDGLDKLMDLRRRETLTIILSLAAEDMPYQSMWPALRCNPDQCIAHGIGVIDDKTIEAEEYGGIGVPVWHSGLITREMADVLARRNGYRVLQPMPEVLCTYGPIPYGSLYGHDRQIDNVIQMLGQASDHAWEHVISRIADEFA